MPLLSQDRALLDAFRRGDGAALGRVYRHYLPGLLRQLRGGLRLEVGARVMRVDLGGWYEVEAIAQDTLARAFGDKARVSYDGLRPYAHFLAGVARNVLLDEYRRQHRAIARFVPLDADDTGASNLAEPGPGPEVAAATSEERALVGEFLASCSADELAIYRARYEEDLPQEEAARRCGMSRMRLRWVEGKLRKRFLSFAKRRGLLGDGRERGTLPFGGTVVAVLTVLW